MKMPNNKTVIISKIKLTEYIFSQTHITGKFKAKFFKKIGFNETNIDIFEKHLRNIALQDVKNITTTPFGIKFILDGKIKSPNNKIAILRTIWIIEEGEQKPRFVTVYPV